MKRKNLVIIQYILITISLLITAFIIYLLFASEEAVEKIVNENIVEDFEFLERQAPFIEKVKKGY